MRQTAKGRSIWTAALGLVVARLTITLPATATTSAAESSYAETRLWASEYQKPAGSRADQGLTATGIEG